MSSKKGLSNLTTPVFWMYYFGGKKKKKNNQKQQKTKTQTDVNS